MQRFLFDYGVLVILLGLCAVLSVVTVAEQVGVGGPAGEDLGREALRQVGPEVRVMIVAGEGQEDGPFVDKALRAVQQEPRSIVVARIQGTPRDARLKLEQLAKDGTKLDVIVATARAGRWAVLENIETRYAGLGAVKVLTPQPYVWPNFLMPTNLRNIANQIAIIAILAVGMTMVIIAGGIDLSVGSMIALSSVVAAYLIRNLAGAEEASYAGMVLCAAAAIAVCAALGLVNGLTVTMLRVPPFIATLGMMLMGSGFALLLSEGQSIYQMPFRADWLGRGADLYGIPNAVVLMLAVYALASVVMTRTVFGRYIYAVGGNVKAAQLSGVPVRSVMLTTYMICGALAGLGGVVTASQFKSGAPTYGNMYEMYVVAAVVVGGTSISGGQGKILSTLVGAFIIAVIQNGMNLLGIQSDMQRVVLGAVIIAAVALDRFKPRV